MIAPQRPAGEGPQSFPHEAQPVAFWDGSPNRSGWKFNRLRTVLLSVLAVPGESALRARKILSMVAASLIALGPVHALAQEPGERVSVRDRPRPEYDPLGVRVGAFMLHGTLDLSASRTDNVFAEPTGARDDTIFTAGLHGRLESDWLRHALAFEAGATSVMFDDFSSEDHDTSYVGVRGRLDVGSRSHIAARARFAQEVEPRNDPDGPLGGVPLVEYDRTELAVSAQHTFNRFRVTGTAARSENEYSGLQSFRDFVENSLTGRLEAELTPRIGLLLQATTDERDYDNTPALSSDGQTYLAGVTINLTDLMRGEVAVGQFQRDYDSGISTDGLAVSANLEWYITRLTTISLSANRNSEDVVGAITATPYVESQYGARVDHELLRNLTLTGGVRFGQREYEGIDRDDDFVSVDVGADYMLNRRVVLRARYVHDEVESDGVDAYRSYDENRFTLGVSFRL